MAIEPVTREELFLAAAGGQNVTQPTPITRKEQLLQGIIDAVKSGGATPDVIENAVNNYLDANPVKPGATTEQAAQIEQNKTDIADLQEEIDDKQPKGDYVKTVNGNKPDASGNVVVATGGNGSGENLSGVDVANIKTVLGNLMTIIKAQVEDSNGTPQGYNMDVGGLVAQNDALIAALGGSGDTTEKTLTSISATYSGGFVAVGTSVTALTGVVVIAHYSDGTSATVTGYTLSGTIAEGSNTITVSYGGKTTTFTVTGVAESGGSVENLFKWTDQNYENPNTVSLMIDSDSVSFACTHQTGYYAGIEVESGKTYTLFFDASNVYAGIRLYESAAETLNPSLPGTTVATVYGKTENNCKTFTVNAEKPYIILGFMCNPVDGTTVSAFTNLALYEGTLTERP